MVSDPISEGIADDGNAEGFDPQVPINFGQQDQMSGLPEDHNADDEEDGESVYMIDGVVMQKIQIEGEPD